jgi:ankyrin repeat protein
VTKEQVLVWINHRTDEDGFTALHFASFRGNLSMINLLLQNGSDMYIKNNYGINVLHVAAQGD